MPEWWAHRVKKEGKKERVHDPNNTTLSIKHSEGSVMLAECMASRGTGSPIATDFVTAVRSSKMCF